MYLVVTIICVYIFLQFWLEMRMTCTELYVYNNLMVQGQQTLLFYTAYSYGFNIELFLMWEEAKPKCLIYILIARSTQATPFYVTSSLAYILVEDRCSIPLLKYFLWSRFSPGYI